MLALESPQLAIKYALADEGKVRLPDLNPVFHRLIQQNALPHEIMIDVADYAHVVDGPGMILICDTAHYAVDHRKGRPGVYFARRRKADGDVSSRLVDAFRSVLSFAKLLQDAPELDLAVNMEVFDLFVLDRLLAPNTAPVVDASEPVVRTFVEKLYDSKDVRISASPSTREAFRLHVEVGAMQSVEDLLGRLDSLKIDAPSSTTSRAGWKETLAEEIPAELAREIDLFETQLEMRSQGKIDEKVFAETRLRRGVYGQRYDNGQRHDGLDVRTLGFEEKPGKGPNTAWDAPGMMRIKIPYGGLTADQLDAIAEISEDYSDAILHVTTRQDIQLHFVHIDTTPDLMRRLGAVGITTREACGNSVRNVTACTLSGVCPTEAFDVTPYARAMTYFLLGHKDVQDFGRKFKISFSGCSAEACGLASMHDLGLIAKTRIGEDGKEERGFEFYVGGGLGAIPHQAKLLKDFVPETEILPLAQAVCRVFARLGEKNQRTRARLKFLVAKLGIEEFRRIVDEERATIPSDPRWTAYLDDLQAGVDGPREQDSNLIQLKKPLPERFHRWRETNVKAQKQPGYSVVTISCPLGDLTADQTRGLADIARKYTGDTIRTTVEQNVLLRWVHDPYVPDLWKELDALGLGEAGAGTLLDVTACPGTDTCKLGIAASRGLAAHLRTHLAAKFINLDKALTGMRIKISGCFNACGQHHIADIGFLGVSRKKGAHLVPHFQVVLGGQWTNNAGAYGLAVGAVPSKNIPVTLDRILDTFLDGREGAETFQAFWTRMGRGKIRALLRDLIEVPAYEDQPDFYKDWGDAREYTMADYGEGECAGELVPLTEFGLNRSETEIFEAELAYDNEDYAAASKKAYNSMLLAAKALVVAEYIDVTDDPDQIVTEFKSRFCDTGKFNDPYAGSKFANYLFRIHEEGDVDSNRDHSKQRIEEAVLFVEAAHGCYERVTRAKLPETQPEEARA